ncbi:MAG: hypothetical protein HYZ50_24495 [Deltaproteobacteria bacterium]|nr:hypothetical protein [Deltaproteobacteria bacterium]
MNRAERRRQAKAPGKQLSAPTEAPPRLDLAVIKSRLQQAASPEEVRRFIAALVDQGFPAVAGEELAAYAAQYHETAAALRAGEAAQPVAALVADAHAWADTLIDRSPERDRRACRAGCAFCCYLPTVLVTAAEAVELAAWLHEHCPPADLEAVRQRLAARLKSKMVPPPAEAAAEPLPCALLHDNRCLAYDVRPLKCRGWTSLRREACEQSYGHGQSSEQIPADAYAFVMGNAVLNGLRDGVEQAALDGGSYDLSAALARVLDIPDVVQRWRAGERLFEAAL